MRWRRLLSRPSRSTNLALLGALAAAFGTGWLAFAAGTARPATLATVTHGLFGLAVVALLPWKSIIIRRASSIRLGSGALLVLLLICLVAGFVQVFVGFGHALGITPMQAHVGSAVVALPLFGWHVLRHRRRSLRRVDLSRRAVLRTAVLAGTVTAGYAVLEGVGRLAALPAGRRIATGSHRLPASAMPATTWLLDRVPQLTAASHRVDIDGQLVGIPELVTRSRPVPARLDCTSGWYADATWTGVALAELIPPDRRSGARSIEVTSVTGYTRRFPSAEAKSLYLAVGVEGGPLTGGTGAPVRLVAPGRRGFWWVKWVASVQLSDLPAAIQPPFPLQ